MIHFGIQNKPFWNSKWGNFEVPVSFGGRLQLRWVSQGQQQYSQAFSFFDLPKPKAFICFQSQKQYEWPAHNESLSNDFGKNIRTTILSWQRLTYPIGDDPLANHLRVTWSLIRDGVVSEARLWYQINKVKVTNPSRKIWVRSQRRRVYPKRDFGSKSVPSASRIPKEMCWSAIRDSDTDPTYTFSTREVTWPSRFSKEQPKWFRVSLIGALLSYITDFGICFLPRNS